jgi:hypothetical protein
MVGEADAVVLLASGAALHVFQGTGFGQVFGDPVGVF